MTIATTELFEVVYALEGHAKPFVIEVSADASDIEILALIIGKHDLAPEHHLFWEDDGDEPDDPGAEAIGMIVRLRGDFRQIHVARPGKIVVSITYNGKTVHHEFQPNATIRRVIRWAISDKALDLVGKPAEFQIKLEGKVIPPETHLGQLARCDDTLALSLVANVKPQG